MKKLYIVGIFLLPATLLANVEVFSQGLYEGFVLLGGGSLLGVVGYLFKQHSADIKEKMEIKSVLNSNLEKLEDLKDEFDGYKKEKQQAITKYDTIINDLHKALYEAEKVNSVRINKIEMLVKESHLLIKNLTDAYSSVDETLKVLLKDRLK